MNHVLAREAATPPEPVIISWSGLKRWEHCRQHQLRVITGERDKSNKGRIFLPGTLADLTQRRWLDLDKPEPGQMPDMVDAIFEEIVEKAESKIEWRGNPATDKQAVKDQVRKAVQTLEPWLLREVIPFDYQPEVKFDAVMHVPYICGGRAPVKMIGGIDILVRTDEGKWRYYDLKMTENPAYIKSTLAQLIFYDIAWGVSVGRFDLSERWSFICPLLEEFEIPITVGLEDRQVMMSRIVKYAQGVWNDNWEPKSDDNGCGYCEAKRTCAKFKDIGIVENNGKMLASFSKAAEHRAQYR